MLIHDLRPALRLLRNAPGFTVTAVLTLALGIGANTAVFSVVDAVLLRPLPYHDAHRLVALWEGAGRNGTRSTVAPANLSDYRRVGAFESVAGYARTSMTLTGAGAPEQLIGEAVTGNLFDTLGVVPQVGRPFRADDDRPGSARVVILSDALWRARFHGDPAVLGRAVILDARPYQVVGVLPPGFVPLSQSATTIAVHFFVPAAYPDELLASRGDHEISVVARLRAGVTIARARGELQSIGQELARRYPETNAAAAPDIGGLRDDLVRNVRLSLLMMTGAVGLVVLIACVNVANLLMVRAIGQRQELAIRTALGATRAHIVRDLLSRGLVLGAIGGVVGLGCGVWTRDGLIALAPASIPRLEHVQLNSAVLVVTAALSLATGVLAALLPAVQWARGAAALTWRDGSFAIASTPSIARWRGLLLASEMAAALVLAVCAGLLVRSLARITSVDLGFRTDRVLAVNIRLPETRYRDQTARLAFYDALQTRVRAVPGVESAAFANEFPMRGGWESGFMMRGDAQRTKTAGFQAVSADYFAALGIPLAAGRAFDDRDRAATTRVAVVSETFVRRFIQGDALGQTLQRGPQAPAITIVGIVGEVRRDGQHAAPTPQVYLPAAQTDLYPVRLSALAIRTAGDPHAFVSPVQRAVWAIDPDQPITNVRTLDEVVSGLLSARRFNMTLLSVLAALAVGLALVGVYGVVAHAALQRTREVGIRVALGATSTDIVRLVVSAGLRWAALGIAAGVGLSYAATRLLAGLLFDVTPTDPATFAGITILMLAAAAAASLVPALRAAALDPVQAIRAD